MCGALVAGEIGNIQNINRFCNFSFAIASLSESESRVKLNVDILKSRADELINNKVNIIDYLISHTDFEKGIARRHEIEKTLFIDSVTGLGNVTKFLFDYNTGKFVKCA